MQKLLDGGMRAFLTRYSDIGLAALVIGIIGMMIIPLPTFLLDMLLTLNITLSVMLLMVSLYIPNALHISAFPSILLITTLFRLALNVDLRGEDEEARGAGEGRPGQFVRLQGQPTQQQPEDQCQQHRAEHGGDDCPDGCQEQG